MFSSIHSVAFCDASSDFSNFHASVMLFASPLMCREMFDDGVYVYSQ